MLILSFLMAAQVALADVTSDNLDITATKGYGVAPNKATTPEVIIGKIIGAGLAFLGVIFFCLILYAGLGWILSMGNEEKINQSKDMIVAAILGLIVVLGAYAITKLVGLIFSDVTGVK